MKYVNKCKFQDIEFGREKLNFVAGGDDIIQRLSKSYRSQASSLRLVRIRSRERDISCDFTKEIVPELHVKSSLVIQDVMHKRLQQNADC
jgi:hypothetical protein